MKNLHFVVLMVAFFLAPGSDLVAQGRYGKDSADCVRNLSFYQDYAKQNNFKEAYPFWRDAMLYCPPTASQNLYINGVKIMKYMIDNTADPVLRQKRVDTLLSLYDIRLENYKVDRGSVYAFKAYDVLTYMSKNQEAIYKAFQEAVMAGRDRTAAHTMITALQKAVDVYQAGKITDEQLITVYNKMVEFADLQLKANPNDEQVQKMRQDMEHLFGASGAASCDKLVAMFSPAFKANPKDKDLIIRIVKLMGMNNCTKNDLYYQAVEAYHNIDPSAGSAFALGRMYLAKGEPEKAVQYYKQAIGSAEISQEEKSQYLLELGTIYLKELNNPTLAIQSVKQALAIEPNDAKAYMILGNIWAAQRCSTGDEIAKKAVFWVAVDYFTKAKSMDPSLTEEANRFINNYSQYFPEQKDAFMYDLSDGNSYTVNCNGLTEQTRVRTRK